MTDHKNMTPEEKAWREAAAPWVEWLDAQAASDARKKRTAVIVLGIVVGLAIPLFALLLTMVPE